MNGRRRFTRSLVLSFSRSLDVSIFNSSFWLTNIPVHLYSPLRVLRRSILTALMRPLHFSYFTIHCCERLHFGVTRDYNSMLREITLHHYEISRFIIARDHASSLWEITLRCCSHYIRISIIQSAVTFYRRYEWTADGLFVLSTFLFFNSSFWR